MNTPADGGSRPPEEPLQAKRLRWDIKETVDLMQQNSDSIITRGDRIEEMELQSEELVIFSQDFRPGASYSKWYNQCRHGKVNSYILGLVMCVLLVIIASGIMIAKPWDKDMPVVITPQPAFNNTDSQPDTDIVPATGSNPASESDPSTDSHPDTESHSANSTQSHEQSANIVTTPAAVHINSTDIQTDQDKNSTVPVKDSQL